MRRSIEMKIRNILAFGLRGKTPEGGWTNELQPEDCVHTLIAVQTDGGPTGWGSVFTSEDLVKASLAVLRPLYAGEEALEPERVSEKLHQNNALAKGASAGHAAMPSDSTMSAASSTPSNGSTARNTAPAGTRITPLTT